MVGQSALGRHHHLQLVHYQTKHLKSTEWAGTMPISSLRISTSISLGVLLRNYTIPSVLSTRYCHYCRKCFLSLFFLFNSFFVQFPIKYFVSVTNWNINIENSYQFRVEWRGLRVLWGLEFVKREVEGTTLVYTSSYSELLCNHDFGSKFSVL